MQFLLKTLLLTACISVLLDQMLAANIRLNKETLEEVSDLNNPANMKESKEQKESSSAALPTTHQDSDIARPDVSFDMERLKYDVEILEETDIKKESMEIEERFRGPALQMNTDAFVGENIEVNADAEDNDDDEGFKQTHVLLSVLLVIVALVSIGLYAALVMWRTHLEHRYGMCELLVTSCEDDDFCPQHDSSNNNASRAANSTKQANSGDNGRNFGLGQA